jgi:hypothetical protein
VTFSEKLLLFFNRTPKGKEFGMNKEFFFSDVLDVQEGIIYGQKSDFVQTALKPTP